MPLVDAAGTLHAPARGAVRIVSLVPSITELVCDLGLAGSLVGRTGFCIHPREVVRKVPKLGGTKSVDLQALRALEPTHVIVNVDENEKSLADALAGRVPHLIVTHPLAPLDNLALYRLIGGIFGREREAQTLCERYEAAYDAIARERFAERSALYVIWKDPWMTVSRDTYISRTLALAGLNTLPEESDARYPRISLDAPWLDRIEVVLLSSEPYAFRARHLAELAARPAFAAKTLRLIDAEMTSWYGSRAIEGLAYLQDFARSLSGAG